MSNMDKFRRMPKNGVLHKDVRIAFSLNDQRDVVYAWIGTKHTGPVLQYSLPGSYYAGIDYQNEGFDYDPDDGMFNFPDGAWTPCYSRGNFGKNYSHGGNWSGHTKGLHPRIADGCKPNNISRELLAVPGTEIVALPEGIKGNITQMSLDCSFGWSIFYTTAKKALVHRLSQPEIAESSLPEISKRFLLASNVENVMENLTDSIDTYKL